jgi:glycosyltransferase involved in cell wall biosynthesis
MNIAIVTPNYKATSETFIQAHIDLLDGNLYVYTGGYLPSILNGEINLLKRNFNERLWQKFDRKIHFPNLSTKEYIIGKSFKDNKIEIVLAEYGISGAAMTPVCRALNIPLVVHFHGYDAHNNEVVKKYHEQYLRMFDYAKAIIVVSLDMRQKIIEIGCPAEKIIYNPYGPRYDFKNIEPNYQSNQILFVGRFVEKKAPYLTILAFREVLKTYIDVKLIMVGEGNYLNLCRILVKALEMDKSVEFKGAIPHEEVIKLMKESFCFVQHSVTALNGDSEGMPLAILEALSSGLVVVSTRHKGIKEIIIENKTGFLVEEYDMYTMAERIKEVLKMNPSERRSIGMAAKESIFKNFPLGKHIKTLNDTLRLSYVSFSK